MRTTFSLLVCVCLTTCLLSCGAVWASQDGDSHAGTMHKVQDEQHTSDASHGEMKHGSSTMASEHTMSGSADVAPEKESGSMDHNAMEHDTMDHSDMDHGSQQAGNSTSMQGMDHSNMTTGDKEHDHEAMMQEVQELQEQMAKASDAPVEQKVGVDEHLGEYLAKTVFYDSKGNPVRVPEDITVPTIILPVYYTCPSACHILHSSMAKILPDVALKPGEEFEIWSVSFDELDDPKQADKSKRNYTHPLRNIYPPEHWKFLTSDKENVDAFMKSIGFGFMRMDKDFAHPVVVVAVSDKGKIVRYLYGSDFLPFDITMAATEAAEGKVGLSVKRMLSVCFNYDPQGRRYVFDFMRVAGFSILGFAAAFLGALLLAGRKKKRR